MAPEKWVCNVDEMIEIVMNHKSVNAKEHLVLMSLKDVKENFGFADKNELINVSHYGNLSNDELSSLEVDLPVEAKHIAVHLIVPRKNSPSLHQISRPLMKIKNDSNSVVFSVEESCITTTTEVYVFNV